MFFDDTKAKRVELHIPKAVVPYGDTDNFTAYLNHAMKITRQFHTIDALSIHYTDAAEIKLVIVANDLAAESLMKSLRRDIGNAIQNADQGPEYLAMLRGRRRRWSTHDLPPWRDGGDDDDRFPWGSDRDDDEDLPPWVRS